MLTRGRSRSLLPGVGLICLLALALALLRGAPVSAAGDRYVDPAGVDAGTCDNIATPCQTIAFAVGKATAGDTIHLAAGTYTGLGNQHVVLDKALTLAGAGAATTILQYDPLVQATTGGVEGVLEIRAGDVTVRDLTVRDAPTEKGVPLWGVRIYKDAATLSNILFDTVHFLNNAGRGIEVHNNTTVANLTIQDCLFKDNPVHGIRLASTANASGLNIDGTTFENNGHSGLFQSLGSGYVNGLHVNDSTFTGNAVQALQVGNARNVIVENSTISGGGRGIAFVQLVDAPNALGAVNIHDNTLSDFAGAAIVVNVDNTALDEPLTIADNTITQQAGLLTGDATLAVALDSSKTHAAVALTGNSVTFSGAFGAAAAAYALKLSGGLTDVSVSGNALDGGAIGNNGGQPATSGLFISTNSADYGPLNATDQVEITKNTITGFVNGISVYDEVAAAFGGVPAANGLVITRNSIAGNSTYGVVSGPANAANGICNWWGAADGPSGQGPGTGDAVSVQIVFAPWLTTNDLENSLCGGPNDLFVGTNKGGKVGGVNFSGVDVLALDIETGTWSKFFEGKDVNVSTNLTGFTFTPDNCLLITFDGNEKKLGLGIVKPHDVLKFCPTSLGTTTAGTWSIYLDGSDVGLTTDGEKLDALELLPDGRLLLSTKGDFSVKDAGNNTLAGRDEDVLVFTPTSLGTNTAGSFAMYLDGSTVPGLVKEDVTGVYRNPFNGDLHITILGEFEVGGVSGDSNDIIILRPSGGGYTVLPYWNGTDHGWNYVLRSVHIDLP